MINVRVDYAIKQDESLEFIHDIIHEFVGNIRRNEPDTLFYKSFQEAENPRTFFHIMSFKNEKAQLKHRNSEYCMEFVSKLYPLCEHSPQAVPLNEIEKQA